MEPNKKHVDFDLDGTLAYYDEFRGPEHIGTPIWPAVTAARRLISDGTPVKIMTARVSSSSPVIETSYRVITAWCERYLGRVVPIVAEKDLEMTALWDDRAVQVVPNTGVPIIDLLREALVLLEERAADDAALGFIGRCRELLTKVHADA